MEIKLNKEESEKFFHSALCNGLGYMRGYGLELNFKQKDYKAAQKSLKGKMDRNEIPHEMHFPDYMKKEGRKPSVCFEDVLMEILRNGEKLKFIDHEGEGNYTREIGMNEVYERVQKTPLDHLSDMVQGNDDATTADVILQTVFFEDEIFC